MFPLLRQSVGQERLSELGEQMAARKAELMQLAETEGLPPAQTKTLETQ